MLANAVLVLLTLGSVVGDRKLVYVTVLFRHGDRSPVKSYPTDPYGEDAWPQGFGQLSQIGMQQHFELGQFLRKRYSGFLTETYDRHQILVRSTDYDRTLMSAEANLAGLYPPTGSQVFNPDLKWQPIPVHTVAQANERLLLFPILGCPRYLQLIKETKLTEEYINITNEYQDFIEMVGKETGLEKASVESMWSVYDTLFCESCHNLSAPAWVTADVMEKLKTLKDFGCEAMFGIYKPQEKSRLQGGLLLGEIVKNLSMMAKPDPDRRLKVMMLSAHDTTVMALQSSLSVFNGLQPPYASCHILELYTDHGSASVSMFYRNDSSVPPYPLALPGCAEDCPLDDFVRITQPFIPDDWQKECQAASKLGGHNDVIVGLAVSGVLLLILVLLLFAVLFRHKDVTGGRYHHVTSQEAGEESRS